MNKAAKKPLNKKILWMSDSVRREPNFLERSEKAKKNCLSDQSIENFDPGHRQGSVSTIEVAECLVSI